MPSARVFNEGSRVLGLRGLKCKAWIKDLETELLGCERGEGYSGFDLRV